MLYTSFNWLTACGTETAAHWYVAGYLPRPMLPVAFSPIFNLNSSVSKGTDAPPGGEKQMSSEISANSLYAGDDITKKSQCAISIC